MSNGIEGLPPAAQTNIDGWVFACDTTGCGKKQHFDHVARVRAWESAIKAGWVREIRREYGSVVSISDFCPACANARSLGH